MRVAQLIGLAGLTGLAISSPTPIEDDKAATTKSRALVAWTEDQFKGAGYNIDVTKVNWQCFNLEGAVHQNIHSYMVSDLFCLFFDGDDCDGEALVKADALGTEIWGRIGVGGVNDYPSRIGSVRCYDAQPARSADVLPRAKVATRAAGETRLCETDYNGRCAKVSANYACVELPDGVLYRVRTIYQDQGAVCKYFDKNCASAPIVSLDARSEQVNVQLPYVYGRRVGYVECRAEWAAAEGEDLISEDKDRIVSIAPPRVARATTSLDQQSPTPYTVPADFKPLVMCHDVNLQGQCFRLAGPGCLPNPFNVDPIESYEIEEGYDCAFYPYLNCDGTTRGPPHYDSAAKGKKTVMDTDWDIWSMACYKSPFIPPSNVE